MADTIRVLYVDDEPGLLDIGKRFLEKDGAFTVDTLTSVKAALEQLDTVQYDAIISDYQMPDIDGIAFLKQLKASGNITPFIIFTGRGREEVVIEALNEGADFYLQKGGEAKAQFVELSHKIRTAVTRKHAEAELLKKNEELNASYEHIAAGEEELRANLDVLISQERALRETEQRYRNIVEDQTEFICRFLPNGMHIFVNDAYCRYFGVTREQIIGKRFRPIIHSDDREAVSGFFATLTPKNPVGSIDHRIIMPDGDIRWQRWSDRAIFNDKGDVVEYQSVGRDITEQKEAEEAIKKSKAQLTAIIQGSPIPKFVIDKDHLVIHWNKALEGYSGILEKEIVGTKQHWRAFYKEERPCLADLLLDGVVEKIPGWYAGKYAKSKLIDDAYEATDFFPHMGKAGIWLFFTASVITDDDGNILGAVETLEDVTETHLKTEELKDAYQKMRATFDRAKLNEERYRNVVEDQTEFICRFLPDGSHIFVNDAYCRYFGVAREDIIGQRFSPVLYADDRKTVAAFFATLTPKKPVGTIDHRIVMSDGTVRWQHWSDRAVFDDNGTVVEYQSVGRDITEQKEAEEAIKRNEAQLTAIIQSSPIPKFVIDKNHCVIHWNKALEGYSGILEKEIVGTKQHWRAFYKEARPCMADLLVDGTIGKISQWYEGKYSTSKFIEGAYEARDFFPERGKSGRWLYFIATPIRDTEGNIIGAVESIEDITESKMAEDALRESERRVTDIISFLPDATLVIDKNGTILAWNHAMEEMTGVPAEQMIGKANYEYALPFYHERRPITVDLVLHDDPAVVAKYPVIKREGKSLYSEIFIPHLNEGRGAHLWFTASPLYDTAGNITGAIESIRDITERKRAEEALRESEERYHDVIEDQTEFICRFLPDGTHIFVNDAYCRYFDKKPEEIIGRRFRPVIPSEDREIVSRHMASLTLQHPVINIDHRIIMPDGSTRWQRWSDHAIFDQNGRVIEYQSVGRDITDTKELEKEMEFHEQELMTFSTSLATANKKLTLLSSISRHDINNQLTILQGYLGILEDSQLDPSQSEYFQKVSTAAKRISAMIQFTKEYEEIGVHVPAWQDTRTLVDTAAKQAPLGAVKVENNLPAGAEVFADPLIVKVFYNLMDNAVRYGGKITTIRFSADERDGDHIVVCEDDGDGIAAADKGKIFDRGFGKNTGLGLALSREILSITGITIQETGEPGKGARFEITVPKGTWRTVGST